jgi:hypothetical protein
MRIPHGRERACVRITFTPRTAHPYIPSSATSWYVIHIHMYRRARRRLPGDRAPEPDVKGELLQQPIVTGSIRFGALRTGHCTVPADHGMIPEDGAMERSGSRHACCTLIPEAATDGAGHLAAGSASTAEESGIPRLLSLTRSIAQLERLPSHESARTLAQACEDLWTLHNDLGPFQEMIDEGSYRDAAHHYHFAVSAGIARWILLGLRERDD